MTSDWKDLHSLDVFIWSEIEWAFLGSQSNDKGILQDFLGPFGFVSNSRMGDSRRGKLNLTISCGESQRLRWSFNRAHRAHVRNRLVLLRGTFRASGHLLSETQDFKLPS